MFELNNVETELNLHYTNVKLLVQLAGDLRRKIEAENAKLCECKQKIQTAGYELTIINGQLIALPQEKE